MKYNFYDLTIEITRECNLRCMHCGRGESQHLTITKDIINAILDNISMCENLCLTGGEPFIHPEMISYLFDEIIKRKIEVHYVGCVTNGIILNDDIISAFNKIGNYCRKFVDDKNIEVACISISHDAYHEKINFDYVQKWYRQSLNKNVNVELHQMEVIPNNLVFVYSGFIKQNYIKLNSPLCVCNSNRYRIEYKTNSIFSGIGISANGNVTISQMESYTDSDKCNLGNILQQSFEKCLDNNILNEFFSIDECAMQSVLKSSILKLNNPLLEKLYSVENKKSLKYIYGLMDKDRAYRKKLTQLYTHESIMKIKYKSWAILNYLTNDIYLSKLMFLEGLTGYNIGTIDYFYKREQEKQIYIDYNHKIKALRGTRNRNT